MSPPRNYWVRFFYEQKLKTISDVSICQDLCVWLAPKGLALAASGWLWVALAGFWLALAGFGRLWRPLACKNIIFQFFSPPRNYWVCFLRAETEKKTNISIFQDLCVRLAPKALALAGFGYTVYNVQCAVYTTHCTLYSVQCTVHSSQCTVYSVDHTLHIAQCAMYRLHIVQSTMYRYRLHIVTCTVYSVYIAHCAMCNV